MDGIKIKNAFIKKLDNGECLYWAHSAKDQFGNYTVVSGVYGKEEPSRKILDAQELNRVMFEEVLSKGYVDMKSLGKNELKDFIEALTNNLCEKKEKREVQEKESSEISSEYKKWASKLPYGQGL